MIDAQDDPVKQGTVERFGHGVSGSDGLIEGRMHDKKIKDQRSKCNTVTTRIAPVD